MKKLLVLAAGPLQIPVINKARSMGYFVIAADGNPNAPGLALADKAIAANIVSEDEMLSIAKMERIDGVIHPCSEVSMFVMGRINDEMHLHGIDRETALRATNKHLMRESFEKYGAPSPKSYCAAEELEAWHYFLQIEGDAILKPSRNSGSRGVAKVAKSIVKEDFVQLFGRAKQESRDASVMIEQFIDGPEFSVEIIIFNGYVHVLQVTDKKTTGAPYFVELGHSQPSVFPLDVVTAVKDAAVKGVKALKLNNCAAHAEVKFQEGKAYIMEIGARLGGDFISTELTHLSTGIDMVAAAIDVALGIKPNLKIQEMPQGVAIRYFTPLPGRLKCIQNIRELSSPDVYDSAIYRKPGDIIPDVKSSLDRTGHVIVTAQTVEDAISRADSIIRMVDFINY